MGRTKDAEKEHARLLFVNERATYEDIADRVGVSPRTISRWADEGKWDQERKSLLTTRQTSITRMYNQLDEVTADIEKREKPVPGIKDADIIAKITTSIQRMETETGLGEYIETGRKLIMFIQSVNLDDAKLFKSYFDEFISSELKRK